jgi:hypothetical protein
MSRATWLCFAAIVGACLLLFASMAHAQEPDIAKARELASAAGDRLDEKQYAKALELAEQAEAIFHATVQLAMIAQAQEGLGRLVDALAAYERLAAEPLSSAAPDAFRNAQRDARSRLASLIARVPSLLVGVHGDVREVRLTIDGKPHEIGGTALRLNPGKHTIEVAAPGSRTHSRSIDLPARGGVVTVDVRLEKDTPSAAATTPSAGPTTPKGPEPTNPPAPDKRPAWPMITAFSIGGACLVAGAITGGIALAKKSSLDGPPYNCVDGACPAEAQPVIDSSTAFGNASTAMFVVGGVGVATGIGLAIVRARSGAPPRTGVSLDFGWRSPELACRRWISRPSSRREGEARRSASCWRRPRSCWLPAESTRWPATTQVLHRSQIPRARHRPRRLRLRPLARAPRLLPRRALPPIPRAQRPRRAHRRAPPLAPALLQPLQRTHQLRQRLRTPPSRPRLAPPRHARAKPKRDLGY